MCLSFNHGKLNMFSFILPSCNEGSLPAMKLILEINYHMRKFCAAVLVDTMPLKLKGKFIFTSEFIQPVFRKYSTATLNLARFNVCNTTDLTYNRSPQKVVDR